VHRASIKQPRKPGLRRSLSLSPVERARRGDLAPAPERAPEAAECPDCGTTTDARGRPLARNNPRHRCNRILRMTKRQRRRAVTPGTRYCASHKPVEARSWNRPLKN
jgi:hypothetical protein